jgi:hypothetical protein
MTTTSIRGLHTCKAHNTPRVGQVKNFLLITNNQGMENEWVKIKNEAPDKGGTPFRIMTVERTNWVDQSGRGNISFNLEIEPATVAPPGQQPNGGQQIPQNAPQTSAAPPQQAFSPVPAQDSAGQHIMRSANLWCQSFEVAATVVRDFIQRKGYEPSMEDIRTIAYTLYADAKQMGYVAHMSDRELKKNEPF